MTQPPAAIVTGAGSGIGQATCLLLAAEGYRLALVGRRRARLEATAGLACEKLGADAETLIIEADLADAAAPGRLVEAVGERWGRIDALVNNAGAAPLVPLAETTEQLLAEVFAVNLHGPALLIAHLLPVFARQGEGCVVNVTSMATVDPFPGLGVYAASKCALESLTRSIMNERASEGIRAFAVAPGAVETTMLRSIIADDDLPRAATLEPMAVARVIADCVLGRRDDQVGRSIELPSP